ncbi:cobyrinate a,c-diamide synthase [Vibrio nitrifigilis]|uniref:Cobyrinate a,c-diamide synthase n=1 Tax=Vibrio nitrifigilis TaxID=2789781 RepID=A0ABS0GJI4_9VIBR|nr:cobyrinate a,c-diamide synthase [Vibrio nitrifigilis]MBF9002587.1 cobyrinate a,c-diamide synthase [Vibrio nitrifigilis]
MKAFVVAGTNSGCGKTTITLGLLKALTQRKLAVQPYKVGPDYIDTAWHTKVSGVASRNLDAFMLSSNTLHHVFTSHTQKADIAVIEGVMGLYDGYGTDPHYCSTAGLARDLQLPVILVVDGRAVSTSAAATVMGFQHFDPDLNIAGVIFNNVNSESHLDLIRQAVEKYCDIPVLGRLPKLPQIELPSRHLGLLTAQESAKFDPHWQTLGEAIEEHIDIDALLQMSELDATSYTPQAIPSPVETSWGAGLRVAVALDNAFNFYYQDNLDLLKASGLDIVPFSPLTDACVPDCDCVYIGGGYPESYGKELAANQTMRKSLQALHRAGTPIYAECGGLMYLGDALTDTDGERHEMVGILSGESQMTKSLKRFGYCFARATQDTLLVSENQVLRGHEFHYSEFTTELDPVFDMTKERDGDIIAQWGGGYQVDNTFATYLHLHFAQNPDILRHWLAIARQAQ